MAASANLERRGRLVTKEPSPLAHVRYEASRGDFRLFRYEPCPTDEEIESFLRSVSSDDLPRIRDSLTQSDIDTLRWFCYRRALETLQGTDTRPILRGVEALQLFTPDMFERGDAVGIVSIIRYAASKVGVVLANHLAESGGRFDPEFARLIGEEAPPTLLRHREVRFSWGVGLADDYGEAYQPTFDLTPMAERVIERIEADKYQVSWVTTGFVPPKVWFPRASERAQRALASVRAGLSLSCHALAGSTMSSEQFFNVWIGEAASAPDAQEIASAETSSRVDGLGLSSGSNYLVLLTHSGRIGIANRESRQSIERFRAGFNEAMTA